MKAWHILITLIVINIILTFSSQYLFIDDSLYYESLGNQLAIQRIDEILAMSKKWQWIGYAFIPLVILLRTFYTAVFLYIGVFFAEIRLEFGKLFKIALLADFVYILAGFAKLVILIFFREVSTLDDLQFQPLSVMELVNKSHVDTLFVYPLSLLNLFELGYFITLAWLLAVALRESGGEHPHGFGKSIKLVTASYGSGLLLWVILVMFVTLNLS
jgi:hypothetical protein